MDFKQLQKEFRKLEAEAGEDTANALISLMELRATQFERKLDEFKNDVENKFNVVETKFNAVESKIDKTSTFIRWTITIGFSLMGILIATLKFL